VPFRTCVRKSVFDKIGFYDENLLIAEDYDMIRRFAKQGLTAHHLKAALYLRRLTPNSLSRCHRADAAASHFEVVRRFTETFTCDQLFPHVSWDKIEPNLRKLHVRCLAAATYLAIGQSYIQSNSPAFVEAALGLAGLELDQCLKMDPHNLQVRQLLQKCQSAQAALGLASLQTVG
jgi:GT2 family glycosyltransferase